MRQEANFFQCRSSESICVIASMDTLMMQILHQDQSKLIQDSFMIED